MAAVYTLIFVLLEMSCEDQSLSHRRTKEVVAHWILQSSSLSSRQSYVTVLPRYLKECTLARWVPLTDNGFLTTEFWSASTSVFLQFIVRPNEDAAYMQSYQWNIVMPSSESAISAQSSAYWNSCSKVVIHLDCDRRRARLKSDPFERKRIDTPKGESEKACINIAAANMAKRVGARMHPCLTAGNLKCLQLSLLQMLWGQCTSNRSGGVLLRMWSSAVSSSLQMSAPQKALDQPSQAWLKTTPGPQQHSAKHGRSLLTEIIKVEINTGQVMYTSCMIMIIIQSKL